MFKNLSLTGTLCLLFAVGAMAQKKADAVTVKQLVAKNAAALGLSDEDVANTRISSSYYDAHADAVMGYLQQTYKGVDVYTAITPVAFRDDKVVSYTRDWINGVDKLVNTSSAKATVTPLAAVRNAAADINLPITQSLSMPLRQTPDGQEFEYDRMGIGFNNIIARLMWAPASDNDEKLQLTWNVSIHTMQSNDLWSIKVDATTGKILRKENLTAKESFTPVNPRKLACFDAIPKFDGEKSEASVTSAKYNVIPYPNQDPNFAPPTLVTDPWTISANANATTLKWNSDAGKDYDSTRGNNVYSHQDPSSNDKNKFAAKSSTALPNLTFNFTPDFLSDPSEDPSTTNFAVTNLFYWNNLNHDMLYAYGFDEPSGNFQASNLSRGGKENDYVVADAQDGLGIDAAHMNNANFSSPTDGQSGRMQMYLWNSSFLKITKINLPIAFEGYIPTIEGNVSLSNKLSQVGNITSDIVKFIDSQYPDSSNACGTAANAAALKGKIALIDRGSCAFTVKFHNAQTAGAKAIIVANVADGDPRYTTGTGNTLVTMNATPPDNTITIPGVFMGYDSAKKIKTYLKAGTAVNTTLYAAPRLDGDMDNGIISHEFAHGLSGRLTGGPSKLFGCLSNAEQMGEGWSDYNAIMMTTDWNAAKTTDGSLSFPIGNYAAGVTPEYTGIRYYPYSTDFSINPWTYDSLKSSTINGEVHAVGEIWCNMLWEMTWEIIKTEGINKTFFDASKPGGNSIAEALVVEGMKLQKCTPGFVDGRNGILKADTLLYSGKYSGAIWRAFARRGLGYSANQGTSSSTTGTGSDSLQKASYDLPVALPAVWGSFTAEKVNGTALLKWTTLTEQNVDRFVVERTVDGRNYTEVANVKALGNSTRTQSYTFTDLKPIKGTNIYRIRLVDRDNKYNYTDAKSLVFDDIKNLISVSPNPARSKVIVTVKDNSKPLQIKLYNSLGAKVASYTLTGESMPIDLSRLTAGAYYISITGEGINQKEKLVIQ